MTLGILSCVSFLICNRGVIICSLWRLCELKSQFKTAPDKLQLLAVILQGRESSLKGVVIGSNTSNILKGLDSSGDMTGERRAILYNPDFKHLGIDLDIGLIRKK